MLHFSCDMFSTMPAIRSRVLFMAAILGCSQAVKFEVQRTVPVDSRIGSGPYKSSSQFTNMNSVCFPSYCWENDAKCSTSINCCKCVCESGKTFFSLTDGCVPARTIPSLTRKTGECFFTTQVLGLANVPAFVGSPSFQAIEISLPTYTDFYLNNANTDASCVAGTLSYYDEHGHKLALISNSCQETVQAYREGTKHFIKWVSTSASEWNLMTGKLLGIEITCTSSRGDVFSSCLVFEVHGLYVEGDHPAAPVGKPCLTIAPVTAGTLRTTTVTKDGQTSSAVATISKVTERPVNTTTLAIIDTTSGLIASGSGSVAPVAIAAGVGAVILVIAVVVVFVLVRRRKKRAKRDMARTESRIPFIVKAKNKGNIYDDTDAYAVPATCEDSASKDTAGNPIDGGYTYILTRDMSSKEYAYVTADGKQIDAQSCNHDYEETAAFTPPNGNVKLDTRMEASNPYYGGSASGKAVSSESFEQNPLYSTIAELRK